MKEFVIIERCVVERYYSIEAESESDAKKIYYQMLEEGSANHYDMDEYDNEVVDVEER